MKHTKQISLIILLLFAYPIFSQDIKPEEVKKIMKKVADWEIKHHDDLAYRAQNSRLSRGKHDICLLYTSPSPRDDGVSRMPSSA